MRHHLQRLARQIRHATQLRSAVAERGASVIEYALLLALIAVVCIGAISYFGSESGNSFDTSTDSFISAGF